MRTEASQGEAASLASAGSDRGRPVPHSKQEPLLRHPLPVALGCIALATLAFLSYPSVGRGAIAAFIAAVLVLITATDVERRVIPNRVILPATGVVLLARVALSPNLTLDWILAGLLAALFLLLPNLINSSAIGMGDVKLALFLGVGLGTAVVGALVVAFLSMFPIALWAVARGGWAARKTTLPLGPFLALGGLLILIVPRLVGLGGS